MNIHVRAFHPTATYPSPRKARLPSDSLPFANDSFTEPDPAEGEADRPAALVPPPKVFSSIHSTATSSSALPPEENFSEGMR